MVVPGTIFEEFGLNYVGPFDGHDLVAIIPAYIERETLHGDLHARWYGPARRIAPAIGASLRPSLAIGAPMSTGSDPLGAQSVLTDDVIDGSLEIPRREASAAAVQAIVGPYVGGVAAPLPVPPFCLAPPVRLPCGLGPRAVSRLPRRDLVGSLCFLPGIRPAQTSGLLRFAPRPA